MQIASLKEQFKTAAETAKPLIDVELAAAEQALDRAKAIANESRRSVPLVRRR